MENCCLRRPIKRTYLWWKMKHFTKVPSFWTLKAFMKPPGENFTKIGSLRSTRDMKINLRLLNFGLMMCERWSLFAVLPSRLENCALLTAPLALYGLRYSLYWLRYKSRGLINVLRHNCGESSVEKRHHYKLKLSTVNEHYIYKMSRTKR